MHWKISQWLLQDLRQCIVLPCDAINWRNQFRDWSSSKYLAHGECNVNCLCTFPVQRIHLIVQLRHSMHYFTFDCIVLRSHCITTYVSLSQTLVTLRAIALASCGLEEQESSYLTQWCHVNTSWEYGIWEKLGVNGDRWIRPRYVYAWQNEAV